jgi:hypothetical protein
MRLRKLLRAMANNYERAFEPRPAVYAAWHWGWDLVRSFALLVILSLLSLDVPNRASWFSRG